MLVDQDVGEGEIHAEFIAGTCCKVSHGRVKYHNNIKRSVFRYEVQTSSNTLIYSRT